MYLAVRPPLKLGNYRMIAKINSISVEEATRGIYLDFEGFKDHSPSIIGIFHNNQFQQIVLDPKLKSAAEERSLPQGELVDVIKRLLLECEANHRSLIAFSTHELNVIRTYCDIDVTDKYKNALKFVKRWKWRFHRDIELERKSLDQFLGLPMIHYGVPKHLGKGNATKRLKAVIDMLEKRGDFSSLTPVKKAQWTKLLDYNKHDVLGLRALVVHASAEMERKADIRDSA